jgi:hypothetical protein
MKAILGRASSPTSRSATAKTWAARAVGSLLVLVVLVVLIDRAGKGLRLALYVERTDRVGYPASGLIRSSPFSARSLFL